MTEIVARLRVAECLVDLGRPAEALDEAERSAAVAHASEFTAGIGRSHLLAARAALALGDAHLALAHADSGLELVNRDSSGAFDELLDRLGAIKRDQER